MNDLISFLGANYVLACCHSRNIISRQALLGPSERNYVRGE